MNSFLEFITLSDPTLRVVLLGVIIISVTASLVGTFTFLRKRAMIGDAVSHSVFPGVCLSFIIHGEKDPFFLLLYSIVTGLMAMLLIDYLSRHPRIKTETSIGIVLATFFGLGVVLISYIQGNMGAEQSGLQHFIFGNAAAISTNDVQAFSLNAFIIISAIILLYSRIKVVTFDPVFAKAAGFKVRFLETTLSILTVMTIAMGINAVGIILMSALLITPSSAARLFSNKLLPMMAISAVFAFLASLGGTYISFTYQRMPTGPWTVVFLSGFAFVAIILSPKRGIIARKLRSIKIERKILKENILKSLYKLDESSNAFKPHDLTEINSYHHMDGSELMKGLRILYREGSVQKQSDKWLLSEKGIKVGESIVRRHRLWELYLSSRMNISSDHVHPSAETLEHFITPEMEARINAELEFPKEGPHDDKIPGNE